MVVPCACGCTDLRGIAVHPVSVALAAGDVDRAFALGLMDAPPCPACPPECVGVLTRVQDERRQALAARARFRQRETRLQRLRAERDQRRAVVAPVGDAGPEANAKATTAATSPAPAPASRAALPPAAAAALARAREKAAARSQGAGKPSGDGDS